MPRAVILRATSPTAVWAAVHSTAGDVANRMGFPVMTVRRVEDLADGQARSYRLAARVMGTFGGLGIVMGAIGIHTSLGFVVARRTRDVGIRLALGAPRRTIAVDLSRPVVVAVGSGAVAGCVLVALGQGLLRSVAFGIEPFDPVAVLGAVAALVAAAACGAIGPVLRAARMSPSAALRE